MNLRDLLSRVGFGTSDTLVREDDSLVKDAAIVIPTPTVGASPDARIVLRAMMDAAERKNATFAMRCRAFIVRHQHSPAWQAASVAKVGETLPERIGRTFSGLSLDLQNLMPLPLFRRGEAGLVVRTDDAPGTSAAIWLGAEPEVGFDFLRALRNAALFSGEFEEPAAEAVSLAAWSDLRAGQELIPGFVVSASEPSRLLLEWRSGSIHVGDDEIEAARAALNAAEATQASVPAPQQEPQREVVT